MRARLLESGGESGYTPLMHACEQEMETAVKTLLDFASSVELDADAMLRPADRLGETALMKAARWGNRGICEDLLQYYRDRLGETINIAPDF